MPVHLMATGKSKKQINIDHISVGKFGELLARKHLRGLAYKVLEQNVRLTSGEIDLVVKRGREVIFVEVKTLRNARYLRPVESVDWKKQKKLAKIASEYLWRRQIKKCPISFMVVGVDLSKQGKDRFEIIRQAFWAEWPS